MGFRPKSLLELHGGPLIQRQLAALSGAGVSEVVVVLGHYADRIGQALGNIPLKRVRNPAPDAGQISSLRLGLQALPPGLEAVLVALADQPLINAQDISDLFAAYERRPKGALFVQPAVDGQPGNPVVFSGVVRDEILAGGAPMGGKQWQAANLERVYRWPSTNRRYRTDVDSPEDIEALAALTGHRLLWPADL